MGGIITTIIGNGKTKTLTGDNADNLIVGYGVTQTGGYWDADGQYHPIFSDGNNFAETLNGRDGDDTLAGGGGDDTLNGDAGNDSLLGGGGNDRLSGGLGNDRLDGGDGRDNLTGEAGDDLLAGGAGADQLNGGDGSDTASYAASAAAVGVNLQNHTAAGGDADGDALVGIENLTGSNFADTLTGTSGANLLIGGPGADILAGGGGSDTASYAASVGGVTVNLATNVNSRGEAAGDKLSGIENLIGSNYADRLTGDAGDNVITGGRGPDAIDGGAGVDTASYATSHYSVEVNLSTNQNWWTDATGDTLTNIENLIGSSYYDYLIGDAGNNVLSGGPGDDTLTGDAGADTLDGGAGRDTASYADSGAGVNVNLGTGAASGGEAKGDKLIGIENAVGSRFADTLTGDKNDNSFIGGAGADIISGGAGVDTVNYYDSAAGVSVNLKTGLGAGGDAAGDKLSGIENLEGSSHDDVLTGDVGDNVIYAGAGGDMIEGGAGADLIDGSGGGNSIDTYDSASYAGSAAGVNVNLATGAGSGGDAQGDRLFQIGNLIGSRNADNLTGDAYANGLTGGAGNDTLEGGAGADRLIGGDGVDTASYAGSGAGVAFDLAAHTAAGGDADGDTLAGIENLTGSNHADNLTGDAGANQIKGGAGDDWLAGGLGADALDGGDGIDTASYAASAAAVNVNLTSNVNSGGDAAGDRLTGIENLIGSNFADNLTGGAGDNLFVGGAGADTINGGLGADTANYAGSAAAVTVNLATNDNSGGDAAGDLLAGIENLIGSSDADSLTGDAGANVIDGGGGADTLDGGLGTDTATYATSAEAVSVNLMTNINTGGQAAGDLLGGIENLTGSSDDDRLTGDASGNVLEGRAGNDILEGAAGADRIDGGRGADTASYLSSAAGITVNLANGAASGGDAAGDRLAGIENLAGSSFADSLTGDAGANRLEGGLGADTLDGGAGSDTASYAGSADAVSIDLASAICLGGDAAGDHLAGIENLTGSTHDDSLTGDAGDNVIDGGSGADYVDGGAGLDTASYADSASAVEVNLATGINSGGDAQGDHLTGIENLIGSRFDDVLVGDAGDNMFSGGGGTADWHDMIYGGDGSDTVSFAGNADPVFFQLFDGYNIGPTYGYAYSLPNYITLSVEYSIENVVGSDYNDELHGDSGDNMIDGGAGADYMDGEAGTDTVSYANSKAAVNTHAYQWNIQGRGGDAEGDNINNVENFIGSAFGDTLQGSDTANVLTGGGGADVLTGNGGADRFDFSDLKANNGASNFALIDTITDFATGTDRIAFSGVYFEASGVVDAYVENLDAAASMAALGAAAAAAHDGGAEYYFGVYDGDGYLLADDNADGWASVVKLTGVTDIAAGDIVTSGAPV